MSKKTSTSILCLILFLVIQPESTFAEQGEIKMVGKNMNTKQPTAKAIAKALEHVRNSITKFTDARVSLNDAGVIEGCEKRLTAPIDGNCSVLHFYFDGRLGDDLVLIFNSDTGHMIKTFTGK